MQDIWEKVLANLQGFVWRRHVGVPFRGTNMAARNQQKHRTLSFSAKKSLSIKGSVKL